MDLLSPLDVVKKAAEIGLFGVPFPRRVRRRGRGRDRLLHPGEGYPRSIPARDGHGAHIGIGAMAIYRRQSAHRKKYCRLFGGGKNAAFASRAAGRIDGPDQPARDEGGDSYILDGGKIWISNGSIASGSASRRDRPGAGGTRRRNSRS